MSPCHPHPQRRASRPGMRTVLASLLVLSTSASFVGASPTDTSGPNVERRARSPSTTSSSVSSSSTGSGVIIAQAYQLQRQYFINTTLGTPPQRVDAQIDTGSSDFRVPLSNSTTCIYNAESCAAQGSFNPKNSSTYHWTGHTTTLTNSINAGNSVATLYSVSDVVAIPAGGSQGGGNSSGGTTVLPASTIFWVMQQTGDINQAGIMGLGYSSNEASAVGQGYTYPTILDALKSAGDVQSRSVAIALGSNSSQPTSLIFGGLDKSFVSGGVAILPVQKTSTSAYTPPAIRELTVELDTITLTSVANSSSSSSSSSSTSSSTKQSSTTSSSPASSSTAPTTQTILNASGQSAAFLIDTGSPGSMLPANAYSALAAHMNAGSPDPTIGQSPVDCSWLQSNDFLTFTFPNSNSGSTTSQQPSAVSIKVPIRNFVLAPEDIEEEIQGLADDSTGEQPVYDVTNCYLSAIAGSDLGSGASVFILGVDFLRSAYYMQDLDNNIVALAQQGRATTNSSASSVVTIGSSGITGALGI